MDGRGSRIGWPILLSGLILGLWLAGLSLVLRRGSRESGADGALRRERRNAAPASRTAMERTTAPVGLDDARLKSLRLAADAWRRSMGPRRRVIDQVCLVPDVPSFLEAISFWDEGHFFPILLDSPASALPFLRAFRPARVIRYVSAASSAAGSDLSYGQTGENPSDAVWQRAIRSLISACSPTPGALAHLTGTDDPAPKLAQGAPGLVLTEAESPMFAGAVALAAGRFQRVLRVEPVVTSGTHSDDRNRAPRLGDVLSSEGAWQFVKRIEAHVAAAVPHYDQLGDDCDFLTLAADWPYRYNVEQASGPARGTYALDDLIGRRLDPDGEGWLNRMRHRWAYAGRLIGDSASSVARAMAALFLQPKSALLWNTYYGGVPWSEYDMNRAAGRLRQDVLGMGAVELRAGRRADLASWHRMLNPTNRFGLVFVNSSGVPRRFAIEGGPGRPADLPRGLPVAVSMIHSFSAADLTDPHTIGGRWLEQGAYIFYGSVFEPYLPAFRTPTLVADLLAQGIPFVAALRQGEAEAFGHPWRLIYLGDPLYRLEDCRANKNSNDSNGAGARMSAEEWRKIGPAYASWRVVELTEPVLSRTDSSENHAAATDSGAVQLARCLEAAVVESAAGSAPRDRTTSPGPGAGPIGESGTQQPLDWRSSLCAIARQRLDRKLRPTFDELLIDALGELGA
ncbi:MAG TPA: hypothetical protein VKA15_01255, partial [Isosphaeraceae bacterium]|nr:hypothetical protein [Isosphaeraceae bacterium]